MLMPMFFKGFYYSIQLNDTLEMISKRYKVSVNQIIYFNKLTYPYLLKEGTKIYIWGIDEPISPDIDSIYTVKFGDNLKNISKKFNVNIEDIINDNYLNSEYNIFIGQKLLISSKTKDISENSTQKNSTPTNEIKFYNSLKDAMGNKNVNQSYKGMNTKFIDLKKGDKNVEVYKLKRLISTIGYKSKRNDDYFDTYLEQNIKKIQKEAGFEDNGRVSTNEWEYIFRLVNSIPGMYN